MRILQYRLVRYLLSSGGALPFNILTMLVLTQLGAHFLVANFCAMIAGSHVAFVLHSGFTFRHHALIRTRGESYHSFITSQSIGFCINFSVATILYHQTELMVERTFLSEDVWHFACYLAAMLCAFGWNYFAATQHAFRTRQQRQRKTTPT